MLDVSTVILAVFVAALIMIAIYLFPKHHARGTTVPGPKPSGTREGNLPDIAVAGSLHQYLTTLHGKYGDIVSFWWGKKLTISIASPELFKEHSEAFDRPEHLYQMFKPLFGSASIAYANGAEGRLRRTTYNPCFSHLSVSNLLPTFHEVGEEMVKKWVSFAPNEHIALSKYMYDLAIKGSSITLFGDYFKDIEHFMSLKENYEIVWGEMESRLSEGEAIPNASRLQKFQKALEGIKLPIKEIIEQRKRLPQEDRLPELYVDVLINSGFSEDIIVDDAITMFIAGLHTSALLMIWLFYFLAANQDVQESLYRHIQEELGFDEMNAPAISQMGYLRQCLDETLRCAVVAPYVARTQDFDSLLGGHPIPKNTPVIHATGVVMQDERIWHQSTKFDPERFDPKNKHPLHAFEPFGFAGKRKCPGYRFSYMEVSVYVTILLKMFKFHLVDGQVVTPVYGLVTHPNEEVWITVSKRV